MRDQRKLGFHGGGVTNDAYNDKKGDSWAVLTIGNSTLSGNRPAMVAAAYSIPVAAGPVPF